MMLHCLTCTVAITKFVCTPVGSDVAASPRGERAEENRNGHHQTKEASQQNNEGL